MKIAIGNKMTALLLAVFAFGFGSSVAKAQNAGTSTTLTGVVSDAMCGAKHSMTNMSAAECTRMCAKGGQGYVLVVGDKTYALKGHSDDLNKFAAQKVSVKGSLNGNTVDVDSVMAAK
jgi:hypothetical protein